MDAEQEQRERDDWRLSDSKAILLCRPVCKRKTKTKTKIT